MCSGLFYADIPHTNFTKYQGVCYTGIMLFSNHPSTTKRLNHDDPGAHSSVVVKALCCKPEGRRFKSR
jgi:hypothetical protein